MYTAADVFDGISDLMYDAKLSNSIRINALYGFREAFQTVYTGNKDVFNTTVLKVCKDTQPKVSSFTSLSIYTYIPRTFLWPSLSMPRTL